MSKDLSEANFADDLAEVLATPDAARWVLESPRPLEVFVTLSSVKSPKELFQARFLWPEGRYPQDPPSMKFRDPETGRLDMPTAWPVVYGFRPQSLDACVSFCSEGFALHPEWRSDSNLRWDDNGNVLLKVLRILQDEMDDRFERRYAP